MRVWSVVETAVSERSAQTLVEEEEERCDLDALGGEAVGIAGALALEEAMALERVDNHENQNMRRT